MHWSVERNQFDGPWIRFLHIPRTGGRYVSQLLTNNLWYHPIEDWSESGVSTYGALEVEGLDAIHMNLEQSNRLEQGNRLKYPNFHYQHSFAIIRNPITRFRSGFHHFFEIMRQAGPITSYEQFVLVMESFPAFMEYNGKNARPTEKYHYRGKVRRSFFGARNDFNGWFRDQRDWLSPNVLTWRFEDGLGDEFIAWVNEEVFDGRIRPLPTHYTKLKYDKKLTLHDVAFRQIRPYVEQYLEEECKALGY